MDISNDMEGRLEICQECMVNPVPLDLLEEGVCYDCTENDALRPVPLDFDSDKTMTKSKGHVVTYRDIDEEYDDYEE